MLKTIPREAQAYADLYHGKTLLLKVSGAEINGPDFPELVKDVRDLTRRGVRIIVTFGGGEQINQMYGKPRPRIDGMTVTTEDVMRNGVIPAYHQIRQQIAECLPEACFVNPPDLVCDTVEDPRYGHVGVPRDIRIPDADISAVGFIGTVNGYGVNVNADDVALQIARQMRDEIEELIFLTKTGGVLNTQGEIVPLLTDTKIDEILQGQSSHIVATDGMLKKMQAVRDAIDVIDKTVITGTNQLESELLRWMGDGTMCVNTAKLVSSPMQKREENIFQAVYEQYVQAGIFRQRPQEEFERLARNHHVLRVKNSPLGGFSLVPSGKWTKLSALWAGTIGNGIGQRVMDAAIREAGRRPMYALSTQQDSIAALRRHASFEDAGPLSAIKGDPKTPDHLNAYDTSSRDPHLFIAKKSRS